MCRLRFAWLLVAMFVLGGCRSAPPKYPYDKEPDPRATEYVIGVPDALTISVWKNGDLNTNTSVRPDGTITMPLIGDVKAMGLTPTQLKNEIKSRLTTFIRAEDAVVTVEVASVNSYYITVSGAVMRAGRFHAKSYLTVADAVALAGGPNRFASSEDAMVFRQNHDGTVRKIPVNYNQIKEGKFLRQNIVLLRGDRVYFP